MTALGLVRSVRSVRPGHAWVALALALAGASLAAWWLPSPWLDWQPDLAWAQPWRAWTAAFVHWSPLHLGANLGAAAVVAAYGRAARVPSGLALAWAAAWPLTQFGLLVRPELAHYGGLSGVLHAGVAIATLWLLVAEPGRRRWIGGAVFAGLGVKLLLEQPWGPLLREGGGWDIATAPLAHASGAAAGLLCAALALAWRRESRA
ncbi:MAG: rhombosortase [Rubrivivax sp.]|nr:rhombosortase [Rubrivivax sp.]